MALEEGSDFTDTLELLELIGFPLLGLRDEHDDRMGWTLHWANRGLNTMEG